MKNPRVSRRKEVIKIRAEINEKERRLYQNKKTESLFFVKINKIDKLLARLIEEKKEGGESNQQN